MWSIWDKQSDIDGYSADYYFKTFKHLVGEETIYLKTVNGRVTQVEGKGVLASVCGIDPALPDDEFIEEYERILTEPTEEPMAAEADKPTEGG
jgi:hypothetical protein